VQLSRFTDLSLRVLLYLAQKPSGHPRVTMREIARFYHVSHEHLRKVVHRLAQDGYLATTQGRHGGIRLGRPAARINVGEVVESMERDLSIVDCVAERCVLDGSCTLKRALSVACEAFVEALRAFTLADLVADRSLARRFATLRIVEAA
jgi:Rrf2 family nitric oxide-sensitive transcriptional repressor